jgi:hypothetical protein
MPDLAQSLQGRDLGHLRIIAELWGLELRAADAGRGLKTLVPLLLDGDLLGEIVEDLPQESRAALDDLLQNGGRLPWPLFTRRYGVVREIGPAKRDREKPYLKPDSPAEVLWYRALVGRAFLDTPSGPEEFAYIPSDLNPNLPRINHETPSPPGRPATRSERAYPILANDRILDHACTLLSALRIGLTLESSEWKSSAWSTTAQYSLTPTILQAILQSAGLLNPVSSLPNPEPTRKFLEANRGEALAQLARSWKKSTSFDELRSLPGLVAEGEWKNNPQQTRSTILEFVASVPDDSWWSLAATISDVKRTHPDYQRPGGDYDSWYLREKESGEFLRGFEHWDKVDGALIRFILTGPLHWLGITDLAAADEDLPPTAFRFTKWGKKLVQGEAAKTFEVEDEEIFVNSDARIRIPRLAPRRARYQVARFCTWDGGDEGAYKYNINPSSLARAQQSGLRIEHLLSLLHRYAKSVPPSLVKALERWEQHGTEARLEQTVILRLRSPEMLQALRKSRAARFLGDPLGPTVISVKPGAADKVLAILAELGYLGEGEISEGLKIG